MKNVFSFIAFMLAVIAGTTEVSAQLLDGTYTVIQGNTVTVQISNAYQTTLDRATNVSYTWTAANSSISIQSRTSKTCTIKGVTPTSSVRLNYTCSYRYDGYARSMNFYYDITVKSNIIQVTRVDMSPERAELEIGETMQLSATAYPTTATNRTLNWTTENYSIASVSSSGLVTARGEGRVWIWARATDGSGAGNYCVVDVKAPQKVESIELSETEKTIQIGESFNLTASILPENAMNKKVLWSSDNSDVATVNDGNVVGISPGTCNIICRSADGSNVSASCAVTVVPNPHYWLTVQVPNGSYAIDVTDLNEINLKITPEEGYKVHSITLNGEEITDAEDLSTITLKKLEENALLNVVFEEIENTTTGIENYDIDETEIRLSVNRNTVNLIGIDDATMINVYDLKGVLIKTTSDPSFELADKGIYIIKVGTRTYKVMI